MPRKQQHKETKRERQRQRGGEINTALEEKKKIAAREVVIGRKMAAVDTQGEMRSVPRGAQVLTNTEKEF